MSRPATTALLILALAAVAAAAFWAGRVALAPPTDPLANDVRPVTYEVVEQTLGRSIQVAAVAEWESRPLGRAWVEGIVTSVDFAPGDAVDAGDILFTVNLRPVVVAEGDVPAFRDLQLGDTGPDVAQLQTLLAQLGFLDGEPDGQFGDSVLAAVRAWQDSIQVDDDGIVRQGDLLFAPRLPVRVVATSALEVGVVLVGGEVVVNGLSSEPSVVVPLTIDQRNLVPLSGSVRLTYPDGVWEAVIARAVETSEQGVGRLDLVLEAPEGGPLCGQECAEWIPPLGTTDFAAEVVVVPEVTGPVVPVAAIVTDPGGAQSVQLVGGEKVPIEVLASTGALAVVSGIEPGDLVVLPFAEPTGD